MSREISEYRGTFIIVAGFACTGKGTVTNLLSQYCIKNNIPHIKVSSGFFFRMVAKLLISLGLSEKIVTNEDDPAKLASLILPLTNSSNWTLDSENKILLKYQNTEIHQDDPDLLTDKISILINYFSGVNEIRFSIFDYDNGAVGKTIDHSLKKGLCVIYDTHFPKGEMPHDVLIYLQSQNKLGIIQTFAANEEAFHKLAELRTQSIHGRKVVSEEEIKEVIENLKTRQAREKANGVCVDEDYVAQYFSSVYFKIMNDPREGLEGLRAQLEPVIKIIGINYDQ